MLNDLAGYYRRNASKLNATDTRKALNEIKQIEKILMQNLKLKGVS